MKDVDVCHTRSSPTSHALPAYHAIEDRHVRLELDLGTDHVRHEIDR